MRRGSREGGSGPATYQSTLGPLLVAMWTTKDNAGVGLGSGTFASGTIDTWQDLVGGRVVQAPGAGNRPPYAPDGAVFGGRSVVQPTLAGLLNLRGTGLLQLFATGTRPWTFTVGRARIANPGTVSVLTDTGLTGVSDDASVRINAANSFEANVSGHANCVGPVADAVRHSFQTWLSAAGLNLSIDNAAPTTVGPAANIGSNSSTVGIGVAAGAANVQVSTSSIALYLCCSALPSAVQVAAVEALALADFPP